jgi:ABC-type lipoprotein export system ATPase subunit
MSDGQDNNIIVCENLVKIYKTKETEVVALQGLDLTIERGELMAIIGNSGSGKSTLLNMLGGLDRPSAGKLTVDNKDLLKFTDRQLMKYRRETVGFVWQSNARNLIPYLTARENVELPLILNGKRRRASKALELLDMVGLSHRKNSKLRQLSGGEQQRVAIAIGLANNPTVSLLYFISCRSVNFSKSLLSTVSFPAEGLSKPPSILSKVDLPLPLLPIIAISSPLSIVRSRPWRATTSVSFVL